MTTKEILKKEIDSLPPNVLDDVYQFIYSIKTKKKRIRKLHSFNLKGRFDTLDIRKEAYE